MVDVVLPFRRAEELALVRVHAEAVAVRQRGRECGDVLVTDVKLTTRDVGELRGGGQSIGRVVAAERGVEDPAVVDHVGHAGGLGILCGVGVERILGLEVLHDSDLSLVAAVVEGGDGAGVRDHHVVHELESLVQAVLLAVGPVAHDEAALGRRRNLIEGEPVINLGELREAEDCVVYEGVDGRAREEALTAVLVERLRSVEVIERDVGHDAAALALGEERVIEVHALLIESARAGREDARPGDGNADTVHAEALAELEVHGVAVVEVARGVGRKTPLRSKKVVPRHLALAMGASLALDLIGGGGATVDEALGELSGHTWSFQRIRGRRPHLTTQKVPPGEKGKGSPAAKGRRDVLTRPCSDEAT